MGVSLNDYYARGIGAASYLSFGVTGSTPLQFIGSDYGNWELSAGLNVLVRDEELSAVGPALATTDNVVPTGSVAVSFVY